VFTTFEKKRIGYLRMRGQETGQPGGSGSHLFAQISAIGGSKRTGNREKTNGIIITRRHGNTGKGDREEIKKNQVAGKNKANEKKQAQRQRHKSLIFSPFFSKCFPFVLSFSVLSASPCDICR
jgi:hypothetical protein